MNTQSVVSAALSVIDLDLPADAEHKKVGIAVPALGPDVTGWCVVARSYDACLAQSHRVMDAPGVAASEFRWPSQSRHDGLWRAFGFTLSGGTP